MVELAPVTLSIQLDDLSLEQLVQLSQRLGRDADAIREQRAYLRDKIAARIAAGERTSTDPTMAQADQPAGDAAAPGAVIEASAS